MGIFLDLADHVFAQIEGRQQGIGVAGMNPRRFDVFHNPDDVHILTVADGIGFGLDGVFQKMIEQDVVVGNVAQDFHHVLLQFSLVNHDFHRLPAQHVAGPHQERESQLTRQLDGRFRLAHRPEFGVRNIEIVKQIGEPAPVFGKVESIPTGADYFDTVAS